MRDRYLNCFSFYFTIQNLSHPYICLIKQQYQRGVVYLYAVGLWRRLKTYPNNEDKVRLITEEVVFRRKVAEWLTSGNINFSMTDVAEQVGIATQTFRKYTLVSNSREEFITKVNKKVKSKP